MSRYKIVPIGVTRWAVKRSWSSDPWLDYEEDNDGTESIRWRNEFLGVPVFPSVEAALDALAWMIRKQGIELAHERRYERLLKARKDKAIHIPPWPTKKPQDASDGGKETK